MSTINAFVGHSFEECDRELVDTFLKYFNSLHQFLPQFSWENAEFADVKNLEDKVMEKMENKNLFIGICTKKEFVIKQNLLSKTIFRNYLKSDAKNFQSKTSDWILQEIGFAFGRGMNILLLKENGLRDCGGIQGNLEYIEFNRNEPSKCFDKILQAIGQINSNSISEKCFTDNRVENVKSQNNEFNNIYEIIHEKNMNDWNYDDYKSNIMRAIHDSDLEKEDLINSKFYDSTLISNEENKANWEAEKCFYKNIFKNEDSLTKLLDLQKEYPTNQKVLFYLGLTYREYGKLSIAGDYYLKAATTIQNTIISFVQMAALCFYKSNETIKFKETEKIILNYKGNDSQKYICLFELYKDIAEIEGNSIKYTAFSEGLLDLKPNDDDIRFNLAYKYCDIDEDEYGVYHYEKLKHSNYSTNVPNNLGASYRDLKLNYYSVQAYKEAILKENTLSMRNLSHIYIDAGFLDEAKDLCDKAIKYVDYDYRVGDAITKIQEVKNEENEKREKILHSVHERINFYIKYSNACLKTYKIDIEGKWKYKEHILIVTVSNKEFEGNCDYEEEVFQLSSLFDTSLPKKTNRIVKTRFTGKITGLGIHFNMSVYINALSITDKSIEGLMVISDDSKKIEIYEKDEGTKGNKYILEKYE